MPLVDVELTPDESLLPADVDAFLREADSRVDRFIESSAIRASSFVPSNSVIVYRTLLAIAEANLSPGNLFCEWGSGFGVVASLAAMLEFDACGIEIERPLVDASRKLADDFGFPVEFIHGSFIPPGGEAVADEAYAANIGDFFWLVTDTDDAYDELGLEPCDFDLVFAYPWPSEGHVIESLFENYAAEGALLLTYNRLDSVRVQRKAGGRCSV